MFVFRLCLFAILGKIVCYILSMATIASIIIMVATLCVINFFYVCTLEVFYWCGIKYIDAFCIKCSPVVCVNICCLLDLYTHSMHTNCYLVNISSCLPTPSAYYCFIFILCKFIYTLYFFSSLLFFHYELHYFYGFIFFVHSFFSSLFRFTFSGNIAL